SLSLPSFQSSLPHRDLHSFPTRRSSDLALSTSRGAQLSSCSACPPLVHRARPRHTLGGLSVIAPCIESTGISTSSRTTTVICLRSEEHTSELQSRFDLVCRLLLEKKKRN